MSRFKYTEEEMSINKVLKMNQDISNSLLTAPDRSSLRNQADSNIASTLELLSSLGKEDEIDELSKEIKNNSMHRKWENKPVIEEWEQIVAQANRYEPNPVTLEDIMTEEEIQSAFDELEEINQEFSRRTGILNKRDLSFLMIATALQVTKALIFPYIAEKFDYGSSFAPDDRLNHNDESIERAHREANDNFRDKHMAKHGTGHWINILYQTVPYDITRGSKDLGINMGGRYHRMYTLGHDPVLGWIFGTANILTDCITFNNFHTNRIQRVDPITGKNKMIITPEVVSLGTMFKESYDEVRSDFLNLPAAIFAQAQHLKSDEYTKLGLPVPVLPSFDENFASKLYSENYDALCFARDVKVVGVSFIISKFFDIIIALTHGLFRISSEDKELYEVKTRKILLISNMLASTSTVISTYITDNPKNLDIGSLLNTVTRLFADVRFIARIKKEFVENEISNRIQEEIREIDMLFNAI